MYKLRDYQQKASDAAVSFFSFSEVKDLCLVDGGNGKWAVWSKGGQLTNVYF